MQQIKDGDSIMLDASSTAVYVAKTLLEQGKKNLTVLTNSVEIIIELFGAQDWKVLSTGGVVKRRIICTGRSIRQTGCFNLIM